MKFTYEVTPTNFFSLPDDKQKNALVTFMSLLAQLQKPMHITMLRKPIEVQIGNQSLQLPVLRTYVSSDEALDGDLESVGFEFSTILGGIPEIKVKREGLKHLVLDDGSYARCFTLFSLSSSLTPAWIHSVLSRCDSVYIEISPVDESVAINRMGKKVGLIVSSGANTSKNRLNAGNAQLVLDALHKGDTKLFTVTANVLVKAKDAKSLKLATKEFRKRFGARFDATMANQVKMLKGWGKVLHMELNSMSIFYPFVSADMLEVPNGITLGVNTVTGAPVIYNYSMRDNYNILLLATSGSGKSVTAKVILKRLMKKYSDSVVFVVDPQGEYDAVGPYLGLKSIKVAQEKDLGFDPFKLFSQQDAADILGDITNAPNTVRKEFRARASDADVKDIFSFFEKLSEEAKKYLVDLVKGPMSDILKGSSTMSDRVILSLKGTASDESIGMLLLFAMAKVWKRVTELPPSIPKIILIDEGWKLFGISSAPRYINMIARMGRKLNVIFIFATQRPEDVTDNDAGRAMLDNSDTKILLGSKELAAEKIAAAMRLSKHEEEMLKVFKRGQALLITKDYRLRIQVVPSSEELEVFSTTPMSELETV